MSFPRAILFVDGENLTMRYQAMVRDGWKPRQDVLHRLDTYVWRQQITWRRHNPLQHIVRTYYYTSVAGDESAAEAVREELSNQQYESQSDAGSMLGQIVPIVFKKSSKDKKTRKVDIRIAIDVMRFASTDEVERVYLASGDGDYLPLIEEVMRRGKQVELLALSSGLNSGLTRSVDRFHNLDEIFFFTADSE